MKLKKVLAIGGSDCSGGAGIQADIFTLIELGVFPYSVITAVTSQNSQEVSSVTVVPAQEVTLQLKSIFSDSPTEAVKIGLLGGAENAKAIADFLKKSKAKNVVLDPVIKAGDGTLFLSEGAIFSMKTKLFPLAEVVTPNIPEAEKLVGFSLQSIDEVKEAAQVLKGFGPSRVLIKGGHLKTKESVDVLFDGRRHHLYSSKRTKKDVRGTGCIFSSAIAAYLAQGKEVTAAVRLAKDYVAAKIKSAEQIGQGRYQILPPRWQNKGKK